MKGIVLAGGMGTRLLPSTAIMSKQLLPVYDRPMIFYPLNTLITAGITDILMIVAPEYSGSFLNLLGSMFRKQGINISFVVQKRPRGLADAYILAEDFLDDGPSVMVLGDNIFEDNFTEAITSFQSGGRVFAKQVSDPERFGVVEFSDTGKVLSIEEKPQSPKSHYAVPGIYIFDGSAPRIASGLQPSSRGELEIVDIQRAYLKQGMLDVRVIEGAWFDTGTPDSLLDAANYVRERGLSKRFHPIVEEAIATFSLEFKQLVKKSLHP